MSAPDETPGARELAIAFLRAGYGPEVGDAIWQAWSEDQRAEAMSVTTEFLPLVQATVSRMTAALTAPGTGAP